MPGFPEPLNSLVIPDLEIHLALLGGYCGLHFVCREDEGRGARSFPTFDGEQAKQNTEDHAGFGSGIKKKKKVKQPQIIGKMAESWHRQHLCASLLRSIPTCISHGTCSWLCHLQAEEPVRWQHVLQEPSVTINVTINQERKDEPPKTSH